MTLTTHAVVGAAVASLTPQYPLLGFAAAFASHFALDSIPHWSEGLLLRSKVFDPADRLNTDMTLGKDFIHDLGLLAADGFLGLGISLVAFWLFFHIPFYIVLLGVVGGDLPDALQFVYFKLRPRFMTPLQRFHDHIQTEYKNKVYLLIEAALMLGAIGLVGLSVLQ